MREFPFVAKFYLPVSEHNRIILNNMDLTYKETLKLTYIKEQREVFEVYVPKLYLFERIISTIEKQTSYDEELFNADVPPELQFLCEKDIRPFEEVILEDNSIRKGSTRPSDSLTQVTIEVFLSTPNTYDESAKIKRIKYNDYELRGEEKTILAEFLELFNTDDPDIINMPYGFAYIAQLSFAIKKHNLNNPFHRWHKTPITYKGGRTFFTYGQTKYRDFAIRLHGRLLVDNRSTIGQECDVDAMMELANLCGSPLQKISSRSFGSIFQSALIRLMYDKYLIPYKQKPVSRPMNLLQLLKADRAGLTLNCKPQFHQDVAEIDFSSMFPWIICNNNISAETMIEPSPPYLEVPQTHLKISLKEKGIIPQALKPILERRMEYKANPSKVNNSRAFGLKQILVSSYGYLRFREFKLGLEDCHMAIGAFAREILLKTKHLAEDEGFEVVFGVVDSIYLKKQGITKNEVELFCKKVEDMFNIPISFEGIFRWIVFLPSVENNKKPTPTKYYGVFKDLSLKTRGIDVRKKDTCEYVYDAQTELLNLLATKDSFADCQNAIPTAITILNKYIRNIKNVKRSRLISRITLTKENYVSNTMQKKLLQIVKEKNISFHPGQYVTYVMTIAGPELNQGNNEIDIKFYKEKLVNAFYVVLQPFGVKKIDLADSCQTRLHW